MNKWKYGDKLIKSIADVPECCPWVVYRIEFSNGDFYIGSKQIYFTRKVKLSKKRALELWNGKGRKPTKEVKVKESDWKTYCSSSKVVQERISKGETCTFTIIDFYNDKREMLLTEAYMIIESFLDKDPNILNSWVSVKMFKERL